MKVIVTVEQRFVQTPNGAVWTPAAFPYEFWQRYLEVFQRVCVVARARHVAIVPHGYKRVDGVGVEFKGVPPYQGPWQFLKIAPTVMRAVQSSLEVNDAAVMRISSLLAMCLEPALSRTRHPFGVEVVADSHEVFAPNGVRHFMRPFFQWWFTRAQKRECMTACGASYVTQSYLQQRYPSPVYQIGVSDVEISGYAADIRHYDLHAPHPIQLIMIGSLEHLYKGPDVLIRALACCGRAGLNLNLVIVGGGRYRTQLEELVHREGVADRIQFTGMLPPDEVRLALDSADVFVLPSRAEGLPRAMLEAMARGLPCIGSTAGGIPELLTPDSLVSPGDVDMLACKIQEVITSPERMQSMSRYSLAKAQEYRQDVLQERRNQFYQHVKRQTEEWLLAQNI